MNRFGTSKIVAMLLCGAVFSACSTTPTHGDFSTERNPAQSIQAAHQSVSPRVIDVKICPAATFGELSSLVIVPKELQLDSSHAMKLLNPSLSVQNEIVMWGNVELGQGSLSAPDINNCVTGSIALTSDVQIEFSKNIQSQKKAFCIDSNGVLPSPAVGCDEQILTLSLSINEKEVDVCSSTTLSKGSRILSESGNCPYP